MRLINKVCLSLWEWAWPTHTHTHTHTHTLHIPHIENERKIHSGGGMQLKDWPLSSVPPFTLPFECGDPAPILCILFCVKVSEKARGEISLQRWSTSLQGRRPFPLSSLKSSIRRANGHGDLFSSHTLGELNFFAVDRCCFFKGQKYDEESVGRTDRRTDTSPRISAVLTVW